METCITSLSNLELFCDNYCLKLEINNHKFFEYSSQSAPSKIIKEYEIKKGDLITLTTQNESGPFGVIMKAIVNEEIYSTSNEDLITFNASFSFNPSLSYLNSFDSFQGVVDGLNQEVKEFYLLIPDLFIYKSFVIKMLVNQNKIINIKNNILEKPSIAESHSKNELTLIYLNLYYMEV